MSVARRYRVWGRVQGVGFRAFVWREARAMQLTGWVRNRLDGTVEALVVTTPDSHERLLMALEQGPSLSRVDRVDVTDEPGQTPVLAGFEVRNDA